MISHRYQVSNNYQQNCNNNYCVIYRMLINWNVRTPILSSSVIMFSVVITDHSLVINLTLYTHNHIDMIIKDYCFQTFIYIRKQLHTFY